MKPDNTYEQLKNVIDSNIINKAKNYVQIYKRTKNKRIKKKNLKKVQFIIFPEIDRILGLKMSSYFDSFAEIRSISEDSTFKIY